MNIIIFLIIFGIIVTFHEFGHYYFAKKSGVHVYEFAVGMGPKIFQTFKNGTSYTIRALPIGGYVRLAGDNQDEDMVKQGQLILIEQDDNGVVTHIYLNTNKQLQHALPFEVHRYDLVNDMVLVGAIGHQEEVVTLNVSKTALISDKTDKIEQVAPLETHLSQASILKRILINIAGPMNNFILSIVVFMCLAFISGGVNSNGNGVTVGQNSSAMLSGLQSGDKIEAINAINTPTWQAITTQLAQLKQTQSQVTLQVNRQGNTQEITVPFKDGIIGITPVRHTDFLSKIMYGFTQTWHVATSIWTTLAGMFSRGFNINEFGGPVAIAQVTSQVANQGLLAIVTFLAFISANLGVMNLLPIPGLDGGNILLNIIELLRGKPMSKEKEVWITIISAGLLVVLMIAVTFNDILRLFR